ncbi:cytochrome P450 [Streptomyces tubbatahanensis]|uniref:Cytochrome P450 n=1 Tax=Streptomyces tubbatahanensis TaxID=2923272 RepID=A0ABY3Y224_9ACTN|nr:cytochrome P450 [Streptomyces tubbatahanensis]UNT00676.1 cytochrome P450 [Streptomyces tubbatahanensis]
MRSGYGFRLRRDPLACIEELSRDSTAGVMRLPWGGWCVRDSELAQTLLRDPDYHTGGSVFFGELLPDRAAQAELGRAVRGLLRAGVPHFRAALPEAVAALPASSRWPDAGTRLVYHCLADLLLRPGTPGGSRELMRRAAHEGVAVRAPHVWQRARAELMRARLVTAVAEEAHRRRRPAGEPRDMLDAVLMVCREAEMPDRAVADLHLMMFRAIMAPVSASLAWSVLLACLHHTGTAPWPWPADHVVREAMRHRPVPWMLGRTLPRAVELGGTVFPPGELLSVCPYLLHHDERLWDSPDAFRPERWADDSGHGPYIPFGMGPFSCAGAAVAHTLLTESLAALTDHACLAVTGGDTRAAMSEGNVPRPFVLHRSPNHPPAHDTRRG